MTTIKFAIFYSQFFRFTAIEKLNQKLIPFFSINFCILIVFSLLTKNKNLKSKQINIGYLIQNIIAKLNKNKSNTLPSMDILKTHFSPNLQEYHSLTHLENIMGFFLCSLLELKELTTCKLIIGQFPNTKNYEIKNTFLIDLKTGYEGFNPITMTIILKNKQYYDEIKKYYTAQELGKTFYHINDFINEHEKRYAWIEIKKVQTRDTIQQYISSLYNGLQWVIGDIHSDTLLQKQQNFILWELIFCIQHFYPFFLAIIDKIGAENLKEPPFASFLLLRNKDTHWNKESEIENIVKILKWCADKNYNLNKEHYYIKENSTLNALNFALTHWKENASTKYWISAFVESSIFYGSTISEKAIYEGHEYSSLQLTKIFQHGYLLPIMEKAWFNIKIKDAQESKKINKI